MQPTDPLGNIIRNFMRDSHVKNIKHASVVAMDFAKDGMDYGQIEEMLFASGFEGEVIAEVLQTIPVKRSKA